MPVSHFNLLGGKGWTKFKDEFNEIFRGLTQLGYAIYFIGHDKEGKDDKGNITNIRPALSNATREVIAGMSDVFVRDCLLVIKSFALEARVGNF